MTFTFKSFTLAEIDKSEGSFKCISICSQAIRVIDLFINCVNCPFRFLWQSALPM